jgi:thiol-disulfide isomerase/thioredoxin
MNQEIQAMIARNAETAKLKSAPLDLKFTALDGAEVDLAKMRGKVVLIDFWATWCGPCVKEIPNVVEAYEELHPKGFEVIGISLDQDKAKLEAFIKEKGMAWPQYFDGKGWQNEISSRFGIQSIPAMWLVDKKGMLVSTNARANLEDEVEKLLAE